VLGGGRPDRSVTGLAGGVDVGVDLVGVLGEVSDDTSLVFQGVELVVVVGGRNRLVNTELLDDAVSNVDVDGDAGSGGEVGNAELLASASVRVVPDKVELAGVVVGSGGRRGCLDGVGERSDDTISSGGYTVNSCGIESLGERSLIPVVGINIVGGVAIRVTKASLEKLLLSGGKIADVPKTSRLDGGTIVAPGGSARDVILDGSSNVGALGGEVVGVLAHSARLVDIGSSAGSRQS
jgi:hypothetical protein